MQDSFAIVKDSSIWFNTPDYQAVNSKDAMLRVGIVQRAYNDQETGELRYLVEVQNHGDKIEMSCRLLRRFGGVFNYEDYIYQGYKINDKPDPVTAFEAKAGDAVLVGQLNGQGREGVILGGLNHAARKTAIQATSGPQYKSEINGIETFINTDGELIVTFKGQPTNLSALNDSPYAKVPAAQYDTSVGTSYYKFYKDGSWEVNDNAASGGNQSIKIDKPSGTITTLSGNISIVLDKGPESVTLKSKTLTAKVANKVTVETKELAISATTKSYLKSPKVAIGKDGNELLDQLSKLIDALGKVQVISPIGPCTTLMATPEWKDVTKVQDKIKEITGTF